MLILVDKTNLKMVAAASNRKWINLVAYVDFSEVDVAIVDSLEGSTWTVFNAEQMATLYKNMSGQDAPEYGETIKQLRGYAESWPNYPRSEKELEAEAEVIYAKEYVERSTEDKKADQATKNELAREAHQAAIQMAESARSGDAPAQGGELSQAAITKPKAESKLEPAPRQGITKKIWDIADELLAVTGSVGNIKEFRSKVIARASAVGANSGTAATQFGHWKRSKGIQ